MMNIGEAAEYNPLLDIDTSFTAYLSARTRSYKDHIVGGMMDYAFDADFSVKQKITTFPSWSKVYKNLMGHDIPAKIKRLFQSTDVAGSLQHPEIYNAVQQCAEKLQISVPTVYVRNAPQKYEIYSVAAEGVEPCIVATTGLIDVCSKDELVFLVGCECGHIQNNHCVFTMAAPYFGIDDKASSDDDSRENYMALTQIAGTMAEWIKLSDVTGDRAGMICLNDPNNYPAVMNSLHEKGVQGINRRENLDLEELLKLYEVLHKTPARSITLPAERTFTERRILAGLEFLSCEILYNWRADLNKVDMHTVNKQALEVRCEIILDAAKGGV
ncbi:MAG: M48 family metalloprotease [Ruminococcus sp.]|nr:M48 family metalloprotease [Ruminococcus sp.]MCM1381271.1 M48 family metalloprotease [Muribaculaceae bacterium]MCM1479211.1 M48 family metalloprotease [Muribaculaceae bacterium]